MRTLPKTSFPWAVGIFIVMLVIAAILAITNRVSPRTRISNAPPQDLVARVARHLLVKSDEQPSTATIQDPNVLRSQSPIFYKNAQVGDQLLVWSDKAVLYSPSRDLLLAVANLEQAVFPSQTATSSVQETAVSRERATIEVRNASGRSGEAKSVSEKIAALGMTVLPPGNAASGTLESLIVTTSDKKFPQTVRALQELLGAKVGRLPASEPPMKGDVLVIVGSRFQP